MPQMNGWQFLTVQRHDPTLAAFPVVLLSGRFAGTETWDQVL